MKAPKNIPTLMRRAQAMYPDATIKVYRGRVVAVDGDVIQMIRFNRIGSEVAKEGQTAV